MLSFAVLDISQEMRKFSNNIQKLTQIFNGTLLLQLHLQSRISKIKYLCTKKLLEKTLH